MKQQSLYIHIPFCSHKCLFCSFPIVVAQTNRADDYLDRLEQQAKQHKENLLDTVYVGGGTPSILSQDQLKRLMNIIKNNFYLTDNCEITMEANPEGIDKAKAIVIKDLGFNRISLGVQSLDDRYLKFLGRRHNAMQAKVAYSVLREAGFNNINLDLMYAFPSQTNQELEKDVRSIASLGSEHLSLYTLTIEPKSRFYTQTLKLDDNDKLANDYQNVISILKEYYFEQYEVSNFAKEGYQSVHNRNYWLGGAYIGLGMGAHGFEGGRRYWNKEKFQEYLMKGDAIEGYEDLDSKTLAIEKVLFGLRMNEGVDVALIPSDKRGAVDDLLRSGFLIEENSRLKVTAKGQLVLDELSVRLV
ncbi:MAG: radical SAM family heme chaperone HemW [Candidatus Omnitrophota bacterium]